MTPRRGCTRPSRVVFTRHGRLATVCPAVAELTAGMCDRAIVQDGPRIPGEELHGGPRPGKHHQADSQVSVGGGSDGGEEHRDLGHGELRQDHGQLARYFLLRADGRTSSWQRSRRSWRRSRRRRRPRRSASDNVSPLRRLVRVPWRWARVRPRPQRVEAARAERVMRRTWATRAACSRQTKLTRYGRRMHVTLRAAAALYV